MLLSGPNLNLLGDREPAVYGPETLADHVAAAAAEADGCGLALEHHQTNHEGELVELVHGARGRAAALVVNAGALTHYSWALHDALAAFDGVVVELHLSNPAARNPGATPRWWPPWPTGPSPASAASATGWPSRPSPACWPAPGDRHPDGRAPAPPPPDLPVMDVADRLARLRAGRGRRRRRLPSSSPPWPTSAT